MTVTEFLDARIAEDEAGERNGSAYWEDCYGEDCHDRMRAECAAKRAILAKIPRNSDPYDPGGYTSAHTIRALAAVYADHPDYDKGWAL